MKKKTILLIVISILILHGCFVKSIHPFYQEKDVIFNEELIGNWMDQDSGTWKIKQITRSLGFMNGDTVDNSYLVEFCDIEGNKTSYDAHLFSLDNELYLDFFPLLDELLNDNLAYNSIIPSHSLAKIHIKNNQYITVSFFDEDWLGTLFEQNRIKISHEKVRMNDDYDAYILTASTEELQKFVVKYGNDRLAYKANWEVKEKDDLDLVFHLKRKSDH